ncbi:caspase family protein [Hymenobacter monticola]|uniref:Caspase family protein n=1 Tax=Hymenobacter monticola TaxID=1705399 RepID=A0ABY4B1L8_9BACT|nr:caspase family protein [Hymenobacter monticola]UOE33053.1 caspase family protein [Hymenobacter monticola]
MSAHRSPRVQHFSPFYLRRLMGWLAVLGLLVLGGPGARAQRPRLVIPTGQSSAIGDVQFSPNGHYMLTAAQDRSVVVWDIRTRKEVFTFLGHENGVSAMAVAPDNRTVVSGDFQGYVFWWDLNTGRLIKKVDNAHGTLVSDVSFSADGRQLLSADADGRVVEWDVAKKAVKSSGKYSDFFISKADFSPDGQHFFWAASDTSKLDEAHNFEYVPARADSLQWDFAAWYSSALFVSACLLPDGKRYAAITQQPAQLHLKELADGGKTLKLPLPGLELFAVEPLDSIRLVIGARPNADSVTFLLYNCRSNQIERRVSCPYAVEIVFDEDHGDSMVMVPGPGEPRVAYWNTYGTGGVQLVSLQTGAMLRLNPKHATRMYEPVARPDQLYLGGNDGELKQWDLRTNELRALKTYSDVPPIIQDLVGDTLVYATKRNQLEFWSFRNQCHESAPPLPKGASIANMQVLSPDGKYTACQLLPSGDIQVRERRSGRLHCTLPTEATTGIPFYKYLAWPNAHTLACITGGTNEVMVFDLRRKARVAWIKDSSRVSALAGLPDNTLLTCLYNGVMKVYRLDTGKEVKRVVLPGASGRCMRAEYVPALRRVLVSYGDGRLHWLDPATLQLDRTWASGPAWLDGFALSADAQRAYTTAYDGSIRAWDAPTGRNLVGLTILRDGDWKAADWVAFTENGLFDASPAAMKLMYYVVNDSTDAEEPWKIVELNQLKQRYYQPDLLRIQLGYSTEPLREVPRLEQVDLPPKVTAQLSGPDRRTLRIGLGNRRGGIGAVSVYLDDAEIVADARPDPARNAGLDSLLITLDLKKYAKRFFPGRPNQLRVVAWNRDHWISAAPVSVSFTPAETGRRGAVVQAAQAPANTPPARLYALVFGTSDYAGTQADLRFSSKDAVDFAAALRGAAERLYGPAGVDVSLYHSDAAQAGQRPSRDALRAWFAGLVGKVKPWDVLVVYLAGHGVSTGGAGGDFYYLTQEAARADADALADPAVRARCAVSSQELTGWLNRLACRKKVLILDACASGRAAETMAVAARDVPASQVRALDRLTDRTGFYILSGSAADAVSYESGLYGQGLLTYALLKALKGAALRPDGGEEYADVQRLLQYAVDEVPQLAQTIGGQQKPLYRSPDSQQSFDLGRVDAALKASITLAEPKPVFMAASFLSAERLFDDLALAEQLNAELRETTARGKAAPLVFTEARNYPGAYRVSGTYERAGARLRVRYVVLRGPEQVLAPQVFEADFSQPAAFVTAFLAQLVPRLK